MFEQIQAGKPQGATHWQAGQYFKIRDGKKQVWSNGGWCDIVIIGYDRKTMINEAISMMCMTPLH
ncbi:hypothetical protein M5F04_11725 [Acinetobacter sp. ANC 7200]|uniref:hypothetical protein n=1 Tax=Acinetobacter amyesii TaxID=2942470 RepID=UPI0020BF8656|nr:hypothetical protein [Acinetobacter amyesii]MCL6245202.1 hypothetical protein [Acinetobacter amyesii]